MKWGLILPILLFVFSCSKIETGLTFAPRLATNKIDDAFDFKSEKLSRIRKQIDADIQVSKKTLATRLIAHIEVLEKYADLPELTYDQVVSFFNSIAETQTELLKGFRASADVTLKDLSKEEVENFKEFTEKKYAEELELAKDKEAFLKKKKKTFSKNYDLFFDGLNSEQDKMLSDFLNKNFDYFKTRILERKKFAEEFYSKMNSEDTMADLLLSHYGGKKLDAIKDVDLKNYVSQLLQFQVDLWKASSDKQKKYFKKVLAGYKDELEKMSK